MHIRVKEVAVAGLVERGTIQIEGFGCSDVEVELNVFINSNNVVYMMYVFLGHSVKCLFSIQNYRVTATFYRVSLRAMMQCC